MREIKICITNPKNLHGDNIYVFINGDLFEGYAKAISLKEFNYISSNFSGECVPIYPEGIKVKKGKLLENYFGNIRSEPIEFVKMLEEYNNAKVCKKILN